MTVCWLVCLLCLGFVLYAQQATGSSISLHRQARYEEVDKDEFDCSGRASGYFVHPTSCSTYYACVSGKAYKSECLPGLLYHQTTTYCEKADLVDCTRSTSVAMTTMTSTTGSTTASTMQPSMISTTQKQTTMASTTQSMAMTTTAATTTQKPLTMASTTQSTAMTTTAATTQKPTTMAPTTQSTAMTTTAATTMKSTMMTSSTIRMTTKTSTLTTSPAPTTTTESTTVPTSKMTTRVPTTTANGKKVDCKHHPLGTLLRNPDDCNSYYECLTSGPLLLHCGPFTVFNIKFGVCDFKYHVPECEV